MFRWLKSPLANALNNNLFPRAQRYQCSHKYWEQGNPPPPCYLEQEVFFSELEKGPLCGCACLERTPQPLTYHKRNPQLQLPRSITEQYDWLFSTRPLDTNHPEHAGARDTGKALLCPPSTADSTLDDAKSHKILAHHGAQPELESPPFLSLPPSASSCEDSIIGDPFFPAPYSLVAELPVHSPSLFLVRPGDTR